MSEKNSKLKIIKVKIIDATRCDALNDLQIQECTNDNEKVEKLQELKNKSQVKEKCKNMKENKRKEKKRKEKKKDVNEMTIDVIDDETRSFK